jgi:hypothetical protein
MRLYKNLKEITNVANISKKNKGVIIVAMDAVSSSVVTSDVELLNADNTKFTIDNNIFPANDPSGVPYNLTINQSSYSLIPFTICGITLSGGANIKAYELF